MKRNPFVKRKQIIDTYIGFHYLSFVKLYNNGNFDPPTLELCKLHLAVLLAFATNKNDKVAMRFYQLKTMDFLVREVNLEYQSKVNQDKERQKKGKSPLQNAEHTSAPLSGENGSTHGVKLPKIPLLKVVPKGESSTEPPKLNIPPLKLSSIKGDSGATEKREDNPPSKPTIPSLKLPVIKGSQSSETSKEEVRVKSIAADSHAERR